MYGVLQRETKSTNSVENCEHSQHCLTSQISGLVSERFCKLSMFTSWVHFYSNVALDWRTWYGLGCRTGLERHIL